MWALRLGVGLAGAASLYKYQQRRQQHLHIVARAPAPTARTATEQARRGLRRWCTDSPFVAHCSSTRSPDAQLAAGPAEPPQFALMQMAGDGRCLFRALATGAHLLENPDVGLEGLTFEDQTRRADDIRAAVCRELHARREEIEPFIDEEFGRYVSRMEQPRTWGGEPELAVAPHVLKRPISVYMAQGPAGLSLVSQYGLDAYSTAADVSLLFHGAGHYDLLVKQPGLQAKL